MELLEMLHDLEVMEKRKREMREELYNALKYNDIVKARVFYKLLNNSEEHIIYLTCEVEEKASLN